MFTLVLCGGGARGFAHAGVLRGLEAYGFRPGAIVGVSMGSVVGVTYALRDDWYDALIGMDTRAFPRPLRSRTGPNPTLVEQLRTLVAYARAVRDMLSGWGMGITALHSGKALIEKLTGGRTLGNARIPVAVSTTDLKSGRRHVVATGDAAEAIYASSALAGVLPPLVHKGRLLADGAYTDIAPIDVARTFGHPIVIAVDAGQELASSDVSNGYEALMRAIEICHLRHADARFAAADLVLRPPFRRTIETLDFDARRECIAAGLRAVRINRSILDEMLGSAHGYVRVPQPRDDK